MQCLAYSPGTEKTRQAWLQTLAFREGCRRGDEYAVCATQALKKWTPHYQAQWEAEKKAPEKSEGGFWSKVDPDFLASLRRLAATSTMTCDGPPTPSMQEIQEMKSRKLATKQPIAGAAKGIGEKIPTWILIAGALGLGLYLGRK